MKGYPLSRKSFYLILAVTVSITLTRMPTLGVGEKFPTVDPSIIPPGAKLEKLFDGGCVTTEGIAASSSTRIFRVSRSRPLANSPMKIAAPSEKGTETIIASPVTLAVPAISARVP